MSLYFYPAPPDTLQLDLDTKSSREIFKQQLKLLRKLPLNFRILKVKKYVSRTGNQHICIQTSKHLSYMERILLQALLGSDLKREIRNYGRVKNRSPFPILLLSRRPRK
jgi:intein/homing endonuclease